MPTKEGGDARFSLKVLGRAGELCEEAGMDKITMDKCQEAAKIAESDIVYELISTLPEHQKLVLYAIALITQGGGSYKKLTDGTDTYVFSGDIYNRYKSIGESLHKDSFKSNTIKKSIVLLTRYMDNIIIFQLHHYILMC